MSTKTAQTILSEVAEFGSAIILSSDVRRVNAMNALLRTGRVSIISKENCRDQKRKAFGRGFVGGSFNCYTVWNVR